MTPADRADPRGIGVSRERFYRGLPYGASATRVLLSDLSVGSEIPATLDAVREGNPDDLQVLAGLRRAVRGKSTRIGWYGIAPATHDESMGRWCPCVSCTPVLKTKKVRP